MEINGLSHGLYVTPKIASYEGFYVISNETGSRSISSKQTFREGANSVGKFREGFPGVIVDVEGGTFDANHGRMDTILIVDEDPERADLICGLLVEKAIPARRCQDVHEIRVAIEGDENPAVIVAHCSLVNSSFSELALLRHHPQVKLIFYCTDANQKSAGSVAKLPEELTEVILRIAESKRTRPRAS